MSTLLALIIGAFIGWNVPQHRLMKVVYSKLISYKLFSMVKNTLIK